MREPHFGENRLQVLRVTKFHDPVHVRLHRFILFSVGNLGTLGRGSDTRHTIVVSLNDLPLHVD